MTDQSLMTDRIVLKENERIDDLERNNLKIIQDTKRFCFGMDAVLLSGFVHTKPGAKVLDLGTGTGIIPILLSAKTEASHISALEIQEDSAEMAKRSVLLNDLQDKIEQCVSIMPGLRWQVFQRDDWRCVSCGKTVDEGARLEVDHIIPRSKGGKDELSNFQTLCRECNIGKSNRNQTDLRKRLTVTNRN